MNLQQKATVIVAGILFVAVGINTAVLTATASKKYQDAILSKSSVVGTKTLTEINKVLALGVPLDSVQGLSESLQAIVTDDDVIDYALVQDTEGKILFHNETRMVGKFLRDETSVAAASADHWLVQKGEAVYDLSFPIVNAEEVMVGTLRLAVAVEAIQKPLYALLLAALVIALCSFLAAVCLVYFSISRYITGPIRNMQHAADRIASGDLSAVIDVRGRDEIASLGNAINGMSANLKGMLSGVRSITASVSSVTAHILKSSEDIMDIAQAQQRSIKDTSGSTDSLNQAISSLAENTDSLRESAESTSRAVAQMSDSIERVSDSTDVFDRSTQETASSIHQMGASIQQISANLETLSRSAGEIASSISEVQANTREIEERAGESVGLAETVTLSASGKGTDAVCAAVEGMEEIRKSVTALTESINLLGKRSHEIGKILNVICEVTDQTNLLSLNAAILAAQAGEHGKAFSVVASEIKSFAERTAASTKEIEDLIKAVQRETGASVKMAAHGLETVEKGLALVCNVDEALQAIVVSADDSTEMSKAIQKATSQQAVGVRHITEAIEMMSNQVDQISRAMEEQDRGSKLIIEATERMREMSSQINTATLEQKNGSKQISQAVENIAVQTEQIAGTTRHQKKRSEEIVGSMDGIQTKTNNLATSSDGMQHTIGSLKEEAQHLVTALQKFKV
jgi:methyl-accepting chemotaxis protein